MTDEPNSTQSEENQSQIVLAPFLVEGEPRIRDLDLAARLGFDQPRDIRKLIARHHGALSQMGGIPEVEEVVGKGQRTKASFLNRKQAIFITAKSETAAATEITIEIIERFDAYERGEGGDAALLRKLNDPTAMRGLLLSYSEKVLALEATNAELAPKAEALDRIAMADGSFSGTEAAKALQIRPKEFFGYLQQHRWIYKRAGAQSYLGYQDRVQSGDLEHKITTVLRGDGSEKVVEQVRITPKGLAKLAKAMPPLLNGSAH
jgi:phage antirepressor YoqD-like protein